MSEGFKSIITAVIAVATITVLIMPRRDIDQAAVIGQISTGLANAIKSTLGVKK